MFLLALLFGEHGNEKNSIDFFLLFFGPMNTQTVIHNQLSEICQKCGLTSYWQGVFQKVRLVFTLRAHLFVDAFHRCYMVTIHHKSEAHQETHSSCFHYY